MLQRGPQLLLPLAPWMRRGLATQAGPSWLGVVGVGNMGGPMAANLLKAGYQLVVHDANPSCMERLAVLGARTASSPRALAETPGVAAVVTMLPTTQHVEAVYQGPQGLLGAEGGLQPRLLIDCSTILPTYTQQLAQAVAATPLHPDAAPLPQPPSRPLHLGRHPHAPQPPAAARGEDGGGDGGAAGPGGDGGSVGSAAAFVDAPVSGGVAGATDGTLTFMCGGSAEAVAAAGPLLGAMGRRVVHCGASGLGQAAKLCNNLSLAVTMAGLCEALTLGASVGLDPALLSSVFNASSARCWPTECYSPSPGVMPGTPASRGYEGGFGAHLMVKDLRLALELAAAAGQPAPLAEQVQVMYACVAEARRPPQPPLDFTAVYDVVYGSGRAAQRGDDGSG